MPLAFFSRYATHWQLAGRYWTFLLLTCLYVDQLSIPKKMTAHRQLQIVTQLVFLPTRLEHRWSLNCFFIVNQSKADLRRRPIVFFCVNNMSIAWLDEGLVCSLFSSQNSNIGGQSKRPHHLYQQPYLVLTTTGPVGIPLSP